MTRLVAIRRGKDWLLTRVYAFLILHSKMSRKTKKKNKIEKCVSKRNLRVDITHPPETSKWNICNHNIDTDAIALCVHR